jgi:hypothetical protein
VRIAVEGERFRMLNVRCTSRAAATSVAISALYFSKIAWPLLTSASAPPASGEASCAIACSLSIASAFSSRRVCRSIACSRRRTEVCIADHMKATRMANMMLYRSRSRKA